MYHYQNKVKQKRKLSKTIENFTKKWENYNFCGNRGIYKFYENTGNMQYASLA